jgi:hypothetical protein
MLYGAENQYRRLAQIPLEEDPQIFALLSLFGKQMYCTRASGTHELKTKTQTIIDMPPPVRYIRANKKQAMKSNDP